MSIAEGLSKVIAVENLTLAQGTFCLHDLSFRVPTKSYAVLMGRTGCGKTTALEAIAGLRPIQAGRIRLNEIDVTDVPAWKRGVGYVPQDAALFRSMTVEQHLGFALTLRKHPQSEIQKRVEQLAGWLQIQPLLHRSVEGLSGGEAQRVALGRALSFRPSVMLLDEPLSSLDDATREPLIDILSRLPDEHGVTVLHVTHNRSEAERLATVMLRMENGAITAV